MIRILKLQQLKKNKLKASTKRYLNLTDDFRDIM